MIHDSTRLEQYENDYAFDLQGFRVLKAALSTRQVEQINDWVDNHPPQEMGQWFGEVQVHNYQVHDGINYQNIVAGGGVFEELIDNAAWIDEVRRYICNDFNRLSIYESLLNVRGQGGFIGLHSGGHIAAPLFSFRHSNGNWNLGQINILMALTDIGPGDGATVVVPGSHKSAMPHPFVTGAPQNTHRDDAPASEAAFTQEVFLQAGDALMFTDAICHGSSPRTNAGERRILIYRYSPHALGSRFGFVPSPEFLERLTPERRAIIEAHGAPRLAPGQNLTV